MSRAKKMTFGSLFAGIGGFDLGFERAGMRCVWQVEIDPYCRKVLSKHWPDVPKWDDVKTFTGEGFERPDVICGGFPCQDISNAGKRAGIDGKRSGLWSEYARIVRMVRPRFVVVENVAALLHRGIGRVLGDLASCGFDAEWDCLPAWAFGADIERERMFLVAWPKCERRESVLCGDIGVGVTTHPAWGTADSLDSPSHRLERIESWMGEPAIFGSSYGVPAKLVERELAGFGNAVVPQVAEWIGRRILDAA